MHVREVGLSFERRRLQDFIEQLLLPSPVAHCKHVYMHYLAASRDPGIQSILIEKASCPKLSCVSCVVQICHSPVNMVVRIWVQPQHLYLS